MKYHVWLFKSYDDRKNLNYANAEVVGTVESFSQLINLANSHTGPLGYTQLQGKFHTPISYSEMMKSWNEAPFTNATLSAIVD